MDATSLERQSRDFADQLTALLQSTLPGAPPAVAEWAEDRVVVHPSKQVPLLVGGDPLARLDVRIRCRLEKAGTWLAIDQSSIKITADLDRTPILRFDYLRDASNCPCAHVQVHAHRGALSHLLSRAGHEKAHDISALHIPVGGARFRPCLEDVIQFLIVDCRFDSLPGWREAVHEGRAKWRRIQARTVARDLPEDAAAALRSRGYTVIPPDPVPEDAEQLLYAW